MLALAHLDRAVDRRGEFDQVDDDHRKQIREILVADKLVTEDNSDRPPETNAVQPQDAQLRKQRLRAMPTDKVRAFAVGHVKGECCKEVDNRERQSGYERDERHQVTVRCFLGFVFGDAVGEFDIDHTGL